VVLYEVGNKGIVTPAARTWRVCWDALGSWGTHRR